MLWDFEDRRIACMTEVLPDLYRKCDVYVKLGSKNSQSSAHFQSSQLIKKIKISLLEGTKK